MTMNTSYVSTPQNDLSHDLFSREKVVFSKAEEANLPRFLRTYYPGAVKEVPIIREGSGGKAIWKDHFKLRQDGTTGDGVIEGKEESFRWYDDEMVYDQHRLAIKSEGSFAEDHLFDESTSSLVLEGFGQLTSEIETRVFMYSLCNISPNFSLHGNPIGEWKSMMHRGISIDLDGGSLLIGPESKSSLSRLRFLQPPNLAPHTSNRIGILTEKGVELGKGSDKLDAKGTISLDKILELKTMMRRKAITPLRPSHSGNPLAPDCMYLMLVPPEIFHDIQAEMNTKIFPQADVRGSKNQIFTGCEGIWYSGFYIISHADVPTTLLAKDKEKYGAAGDVDGGQIQILGQDAMMMATPNGPATRGERFPYPGKVVVKPMDYDNIIGWAYKHYLGFKRPIRQETNPFDGQGYPQDRGVLTVYAAFSEAGKRIAGTYTGGARSE